MLCSLLSSKVQNTAATFDHSNRFKMPWVAELSYSLFQHAWLNMLPCRSSAGASKCGGSIWGKFCGSQAHYTVCSMHSQMKCSGCWIFYSIKIQASYRWWPSHEQPTLHCRLISSFFCPAPTVENTSHSQTKCFTNQKKAACEEQMTGLQILREFLKWIVQERRIPWYRAKVGCGKLSFFRRYLLHS